MNRIIEIRKFNTPKGNKISGNEYNIFLFGKFVFAIDRRR